MIEKRYPQDEQVQWVCDNLNTHIKGAFYAVFEPEPSASHQVFLHPKAWQLAQYYRN